MYLFPTIRSIETTGNHPGGEGALTGGADHEDEDFALYTSRDCAPSGLYIEGLRFALDSRVTNTGWWCFRHVKAEGRKGPPDGNISFLTTHREQFQKKK